MKDAMQFLLYLVSVVTIIDIVVVHWLLGRHRLYQGRHVLLAESSLLLFSSLFIVALRPDANRV